MFTSKLDGQMIPHVLFASVKEKKVFPTLLSHQEQIERLKDLRWRRKWQPTAVFLPGKSHEQRSLVGYSPWGPKYHHRQEPVVIRVFTGFGSRRI